MISIITPTIRKSGLPIVKKALESQLNTDWEWLIGSSFDPEMGTWVKDDFEGGIWTLNRIYNKLIKKAKGDLIISWQDYTWADEETLDKFAYCYELDPKALVSGVGNKYEDETWQKQTWQDPRQRSDQGQYYPCTFSDIEWNFCSVPKQAMIDVGGFDEKADFLYFGMDGYGVNERLSQLGGYDFKLNQKIESFSLGHGRPEGWDEKNGIGQKYQLRKKELMELDAWPKLEYLE